MARCARPLRHAVVGMVLSLSASFASALEDPIAAAVDALKAGDYEKAVLLTLSVGADDPQRLRAAYVLGEANLALERWSGAEAAFKEILATKPENVPALVGLARAQVGSGATVPALETLKKAVKLDPKDAAARRTLGEARFAAGDNDAAKSELEAAVKLDPKDTATARSLVEVCLKLERLELAQKEAERIAKAVPEHPMGHFLIGYVLDRQGRDKNAIEAYEKALTKDDGFIDAHKNLAILCVARNPGYENKERTAKALAHFERYFALGGKDPELKTTYAKIQEFLATQKGGKTK